ncbi:MAG: metallophosphoesterase family protein [Clostridia bacterium]|nr:metallophosphoesterase family protein [Clostridia bacterium]
MILGILSDTHDLLRPEVLSALRGCDAILHGGDVSHRPVLDQLEALAPVKAVRGNNDRDWAEELPLTLDFELGGLRICMAHKKKDLPARLSDYDLAVCGHTHQYAANWIEAPGGRRTLVLNPGSCGPRRFLQPITLARLTVQPVGFTVERIDLPHSAAEAVPHTAGADLRQQIELVVRETQRGQSVDAIARRHGLDRALVEQIARLYVTHPGVTTDGIMTKMGL